MAKQSFLLVSLKENKAKELAQVISNDSCRKILDYLAEKQHSTETEIAQKLTLPISTVHYNLQQLMKSGIITVDEFHYSEKGREVNHYKLANKYIIIAPKSVYGIKEKLRAILPVGLLALVGAGIIQAYTKLFRGGVFGVVKSAAMESADMVAAPAMQSAAEQGANAVIERAPEAAQQVIQTAPNYALWFLFGCVFVIVLMVIFELIKIKREK
ncbi:MAG: helix-turn-helix domain-containing protein [Nanoarchaeota archaeon]|nr:helix-turn-helix domain-containing protein [Nanoarchaeota archaeon]MBU1004267.1 helix-turn-helix domain-containing protein [Nanoarchaeota archaeon]MBU1946144.1 helix-turn-helix domain-containing protein [Nanoarchaeota archaeon]